MPKGTPRDLTGQRFGQWTVIKKSEVQPIRGKLMWDCVCDCGVRKPVQNGNLMYGHSTRCRDCYKRTCGSKTKTKTV